MTGVFDDLQTIKKCLMNAENMDAEEKLEFFAEFCDELISAMHSLCHRTEHFSQNRKISMFRAFMIELETQVEFWTDRIEGEDLLRKMDYANLMKCDHEWFADSDTGMNVCTKCPAIQDPHSEPEE